MKRDLLLSTWCGLLAGVIALPAAWFLAMGPLMAVVVVHDWFWCGVFP